MQQQVKKAASQAKHAHDKGNQENNPWQGQLQHPSKRCTVKNRAREWGGHCSCTSPLVGDPALDLVHLEPMQKQQHVQHGAWQSMHRQT
jgi:hypothetical protein